MCSMVFVAVLLAVVVVRSQEEDLSLKPLPSAIGENDRPPQMEKADALLSDWEGQHFAILDGDQDKVAISWTIENDYIMCQVRYFFLTTQQVTQIPPLKNVDNTNKAVA